MRLAALVSGGKDGLAALHRVASQHEIRTLLSVSSDNSTSYMFHTYNTSLVQLQSETLGLPLLSTTTAGKKEEELQDLKRLLARAKSKHNIEGVVSGAIESNYQRSRLETICHDLNLQSLMPLWQSDKQRYLRKLAKQFKVIIVAVAAAGLDKSWLGRVIDQKAIKELEQIKQDYGINLAFEGGEAETLVVNAPRFKHKIEIKNSVEHWDGRRGHLEIKEATLNTR